MDTYKLLLEVFHQRYKEENWAKNFGIVKTAFFEMFVPIEILGPEEMILSFAKFLSKHLLDPLNMFHDIFMFDKTKKK